MPSYVPKSWNIYPFPWLAWKNFLEFLKKAVFSFLLLLSLLSLIIHLIIIILGFLLTFTANIYPNSILKSKKFIPMETILII